MTAQNIERHNIAQNSMKRHMLAQNNIQCRTAQGSAKQHRSVKGQCSADGEMQRKTEQDSAEQVRTAEDSRGERSAVVNSAGRVGAHDRTIDSRVASPGYRLPACRRRHRLRASRPTHSDAPGPRRHAVTAGQTSARGCLLSCKRR